MPAKKRYISNEARGFDNFKIIHLQNKQILEEQSIFHAVNMDMGATVTLKVGKITIFIAVDIIKLNLFKRVQLLVKSCIPKLLVIHGVTFEVCGHKP